MRKLSTALIITILLISASAFAAPGIPGIVAASVGIATEANPQALGFNAYRGTYALIADCEGSVRVLVYDYQDDGGLHYLGSFTDSTQLNIVKSGTIILLAYPGWNGDSVTMMVLR